MNKERIVEVLNRARSDELAAIMQYMKHHYEGEGMESPEILEMFKQTAKDEMKHAEALGERIVYLGGKPTTKLSEIKQGGDLKRMIQDDLDNENKAIGDYREFIKLCAAEGDPVTRLLLENILSDEEGHADNWETVLGVRK